MLKTCVSAALLLTFIARCSASAKGSEVVDLRTAWSPFVDEWATGRNQRKGQICDPWRRHGDAPGVLKDEDQGCVVMWLAKKGDAFTVKDLPLNQQNNFQNSQHYKRAYTLHGDGMVGSSLPRAGNHIDPVCYIVNVSGTVTLGFEEGNGDNFGPCPGARNGIPYTEEQILAASNEQLNEMCAECYEAVCNGGMSSTHCGGHGFIQVGTGNDNPVGEIVEQADQSYHCHLAIQDQGTCDYVQYNQHEASREYYMDYAVACGWHNIRHLNITHCDCTLKKGQNNGCGRQECLDMAYEGVVCGNCAQCEQYYTYLYIFAPTPNNFYQSTFPSQYNTEYWGVCGKVRTAKTPSERAYWKMQCSRALFCQGDNDLNPHGCTFHCHKFGIGSEVTEDPKCVAANRHAGAGRRRLLSSEAENQESEAQTAIVTDVDPSAVVPTV